MERDGDAYLQLLIKSSHHIIARVGHLSTKHDGKSKHAKTEIKGAECIMVSSVLHHVAR